MHPVGSKRRALVVWKALNTRCGMAWTAVATIALNVH